MFFCASLLGIPGTGNFIGEILILLGAFEQYPVFVVLATFSLVWAGLYSLLIIYRALFGEKTVPETAVAKTAQSVAAKAQLAKATYATATPAGHKINHSYEEEVPADKSVKLHDLNKRELTLLLVLAIGLVWLGLYPQPVLDTSSHALQWINNAYTYHEVVNFDVIDSVQSAVATGEVR